MKRLRLLFHFGSSLVWLHPKSVGVYIVTSFLSQTLIPVGAYVWLGKVTDIASDALRGSDRNHQQLPRAFAIWLVLTLLVGPLKIMARMAQTKMDNEMESHLRATLFNRVLHQSPSFFQRFNPARLTNILTQTAVEAQQAVRLLLVDPLLQFASLVIATGAIIRTLNSSKGQNPLWLVVLVVILGLLSVVLVQARGQKPVYEGQRELQEQRFKVAGLVDSAVKAPEEIQAMDAERFFELRHSEDLNSLMKFKQRVVLVMESINAAIGVPSDLLQLLVVGLVVHQIYGGHQTLIQVGAIPTLFLLTQKLMEPFRIFSGLGIAASSSWPSIELISGLLNENIPIQDSSSSRSITSLSASLAVQDLSFRYSQDGPDVFHNLSFEAPPGKITALVARMGQGKTTFFRLALRFYDPQTGVIRIGNVPIQEFKLKELRQQAVMMSQFPTFFYDTVRNNFLMAKPNATSDEILKLCDSTGLLSILERAIGASPLDRDFAAGVSLSGGERRLFALTRCLLRNPTFLFLDEPTTNMSNDEKYSLIPGIRTACKDRTVIVVDHDIHWLVQFADYFLVLEGGEITQQGMADDLLHREGLLKLLYEMTLHGLRSSSGAVLESGDRKVVQ